MIPKSAPALLIRTSMWPYFAETVSKAAVILSSDSMSIDRPSNVEAEAGDADLSAAMGSSARDVDPRTPSSMWYGRSEV